MTNLVLYSVTHIENCGCRPYGGMALDGKNLYVSADGAPIIFRITFDGKIAEKISTRNPYRSICADASGGVFWALSETGTKLYQLNSRFQEIDRMSLCLPGSLPANSLGYSWRNRTLLLCTQNAICEVSTCGKVRDIVHESRQEWNQSASEFHGALTIASHWENSPGIIRMSDRCGCLNSIACIPDFHRARSICPLYSNSDCSRLYFLTSKKEEYSCLLEYRYLEIKKKSQDCPDQAQTELSEMVCIQTVQIDQ